MFSVALKCDLVHFSKSKGEYLPPDVRGTILERIGRDRSFR